MAISRHSQIFQAKEYVKPFDLSTYGSLINERQRVFDTNLKTLGSSLAKYTNLPIYRSADKEYVAGKIQNLSTQVNQLNATDYSDPGVFSQINSMISSIGDDTRIKNALLSSSAIDKDGKDFEQSKKDGKFSLANQYELLAAQSKYLNSTDENATYQSPGYKPYNKDGLEATIQTMLKMKKDGSASVTTVDANGNQIPAVYTWEGLKPEDVRTIAKSLTSADDYDQLHRDAQYTWRGVTDRPDDAYSRDWIVNQNKLIVSNRINVAQETYNQMALNREQILQQPDSPTKADELARIEAGMKAQQSNVQTIQSQLSDTEYLYKNGVENLYNLKNNAYLEDRFFKLGSLVGYDITKVQPKGGTKTTGHGQDLTYQMQNASYTYEPSVEDNSDFGYTRNFFTSKMNEINSKLGTDGKMGSLTSNVLQKLKAADPAKATFSEAALMGIYKEKERLFNTGKLDKPEDEEMRRHFVEVSQLKAEKWLTEQSVSKVQTNLEKDPTYITARNGLNASVKNDLKPSYELTVQTDYGQSVKKTYSKEAVLNYIIACEQVGSQAGRPYKNTGLLSIGALQERAGVQDWFNQPIMDVSKELPKQSGGDNSLIEDVNKGMSRFKLSEDKAKSFSNSIPGALQYYGKESVDFIGASLRPWGKDLTGAAWEYVDPLANLERDDPRMKNHLTLRQEYANVVKDSEEKAYKELGFITMFPTFAPSNDSKIQNELLNPAQNIVSTYEQKDAKDRSVKSVTGLRLYPNNQIGITYTYKEGSDEKSATVKVDRNVAGTFSSYLPEDEYIFLQNGINNLTQSQGTSENVEFAPKASFGNFVMPYRIYKTFDNQFGLQIFDNGKLLPNQNPDWKFGSVKQLVRYANDLAAKTYEKRRGITR